ncbi:hypothetical protein Ciccas_014285 [Cichlidogyrus casuarinus]|uniref:Uncharacterized protein n=1 Tax=Cichlidogyrus casuarinus TaxID=1844966 RepID=A0ABD2PJ83_9PLAT
MQLVDLLMEEVCRFKKEHEGNYVPLSLKVGQMVVIHLDNYDTGRYHGTCILPFRQLRRQNPYWTRLRSPMAK